MTGLEIIKAPGTTAGEIADIISKPCPPIIPAECDKLSCRECWLAWLTTGEPPRENDEGEPVGEGIELDRLRQLLREVDAFVQASRNEKEPPDGRTAQAEEELARLKQLLREVDDFVNECSRARTSR